MVRSTGGTLCVQLHAVAGLASTHTAPFVRLLHDDVVGRRDQDTEKTPRLTILALELPDDQALPATRQRSHHVRSEYTVSWDLANEACRACLPIEVEWLEVQVWNRFDDVAVFLGVTKISLRASRRVYQSDEESTRAMWYPLELGRDLGQLKRGASNLSLQVSFSWHPHDDRTKRIQQQMIQRRQGKEEEREDAASSNPLLVDPSFLFVEPSTSIEWSTIVAANVRRMFYHGDIDELHGFYENVLYGDMDQEMQDDDTIVVDEGYLQAFRLSQLSAQYLDHCVTLLDGRRNEYTDLYHTLTKARRDRRREHKQLVEQKRRLQKELGDVDLLVSTYEKLLEHHGKLPSTSIQQTQSLDVPSLPLSPEPLASPSRDVAGVVVSTKPAFLMTWEEREQSRKEQKERDKAQRIDDEKLRLQRLFQDRYDREARERGLATLTERRRDRCVRVLQSAARSFVLRRRLHLASVSTVAARTIQTQVRQWMCQRKWPQTRLRLRQSREQRRMHQCDVESTTMRQREQDEAIKTTQFELPDLLSDDDGISIGSPHAKPVEAVALVAMYKKLKRIFTLACAKGAHPTAVFTRLDSRDDGVLDRAEFRVGVRYFGIRLNRPMTRAILSLVRAKGGDAPRPLTLTLAQFVRGFELSLVPVSPGSIVVPTGDLEESIEATPVEIWPPVRSDLENDDEVMDRETSQTIEAVADAVAALRRRVLHAAQAHLAARHHSITNYSAFRAAVTYVFEAFDVDGNGELDLHELVACLASIDFHVTPENLVIVQECFVSNHATSQSISIAEFISFTLAGMNVSTTKPVDEELGILGYRLRDAILGRVKRARKQTDSIENAVRLVFKEVYRTKQACSRREFVRVLASLRLGFTPAQLSRLVLRLDRDGDETISFDEVLTWLRLSLSSEASSVRPTQVSTTSKGNGSVGLIRAVFLELAGVSETTVPHKLHADRVVRLFHRIDRNDSQKIHTSELEAYFSGVELSELQVLSQRNDSESPIEAAWLARETMKLIDLNGNGVVTIEEWMGFMLKDTITLSHQHRDRYATVERVRAAMRKAFAIEAALLDWFRAIPGAIAIDKSLNAVEKKVRTREVKNAMRVKLSSLEIEDLTQALTLLDADGSGWITEKELCAWQSPTRDIEELLVVITNVWTAERQLPKHSELTADAFGEVLYRRFDHDGNGVIARKELREGFQAFRVLLNEDEAQVLITAFDSDCDGFWNRTEFKACVDQLVHPTPTDQVAGEHPPQFDQYSSDSQSHSDDGEGYDSPDPGHQTEDEGIHRRDKNDDEEDEEDEEYSLGELSSPAMSPIHFDKDAIAEFRQQRTTGVEYSEDFADDA